MKAIRIGELFCGAGGFAIGASMAAQTLGVRVRHVWATDINEHACESYKANHPSTDVYCEDIRRLNLADLEVVDGLSFGFPCNSFSVVGRRRGMHDQDYGNLFEYCAEAIDIHRPMWFVAENVPNLKSMHKGKAFEAILEAFSAPGYTVKTRVLKFEYLGVPQSRHRLVFVGIRNDLDLYKPFKWPKKTEEPEPCRRWLKGISADDPLHVKTQPKELLRRVLAAINPGENYKQSLDRIPAEHRPTYRDADKIFSTYYRRLHPDEPAPTITADGGGGQWPCHHKELRELTLRELARLQTFPDDYYLSGTTKRILRSQIGMAVPPLGISKVYKKLWESVYGV